MEIIPMFTFSLFPTSVYVIIVANDLKKTQNAYRRVHGSPDLRLDDHMMCDAQNYAQKMASKGVLEHQSSAILARRGVGENIGMSCVPARNGPLTYLKVQKMARNRQDTGTRFRETWTNDFGCLAPADAPASGL